MHITINPNQTNEQKHKLAYDVLDYALKSETPVTLEATKGENSYTKKQRGALHVWCNMCSETLNDAGITCKRLSVFGDNLIELPWTGNLFKEIVYKPVLEALTGKTSTEDQTTVNPSDVAMVIARQYGHNGLICPPWPSNR